MSKTKKQKSNKTAKPAPAKKPVAAPTERDPRQPAPGTTIERVYKKQTYTVEVVNGGFKYDGREWRSLTAIAKEITKAPAISGPRFFGLAKPAAGKENAK